MVFFVSKLFRNVLQLNSLAKPSELKFLILRVALTARLSLASHRAAKPQQRIQMTFCAKPVATHHSSLFQRPSAARVPSRSSLKVPPLPTLSGVTSWRAFLFSFAEGAFI